MPPVTSLVLLAHDEILWQVSGTMRNLAGQPCTLLTQAFGEQEIPGLRTSITTGYLPPIHIDIEATR